ncbi:MAG TPA: hypothetical protein VHM70_27780 [Polyangiaceae bacterium]|nr:hypothetical protein [Polyangiaceae bacterium]
MDGRAAVSSLAHRPPALLLECALGDDTRGRACFRATSLSHWSWPQLMDAAAQAAGLVAKRQLPDTKGILVVVAYDQVELADMNTPIERTLSQCPIELRVRMVRTIRNLLQLEVLGVQCLPMADQPLLRLKVTLAPLPTESRT